MFKKLRALVLLALIIFIIYKGYSFIIGDFKSSEEIIVIDPGHGGEDPGAIGFSGKYEKDINLEISQKLNENLRSKGYKTILTRDSDQYIENLARADLANKKKSRIFISIHGNAMDNDSSVDGIQVLYYPSRESTVGDLNNSELAQIMMNSIVNGTGARNRGIIERTDLTVLRHTKMPAILIEYGFLSNENEERLLLTDEYQDLMVDSIVDGLESYFNMNLEN